MPAPVPCETRESDIKAHNDRYDAVRGSGRIILRPLVRAMRHVLAHESGRTRVKDRTAELIRFENSWSQEQLGIETPVLG